MARSYRLDGGLVLALRGFGGRNGTIVSSNRVKTRGGRGRRGVRRVRGGGG